MESDLPSVVAVPAHDVMLVTEAIRWQEMVDGYAVDSHAMYEAAGDDLRRVKELHKRLDDERKRIKEPSLEACRRVDAFFKRPLDMLKVASDTINARMVEYGRAERARAAEEQRRLEEAAAMERAAAEARAIELSAQGRHEEAQAVTEIAALAIAPKASVELPRAEGTHTRAMWQAEVTDFGALIEHVAATYKERPEVLEYLSAEMPTLNRLAVAYKDRLNIPGVKATPKLRVVARG